MLYLVGNVVYTPNSNYITFTSKLASVSYVVYIGRFKVTVFSCPRKKCCSILPHYIKNSNIFLVIIFCKFAQLTFLYQH